MVGFSLSYNNIVWMKVSSQIAIFVVILLICFGCRREPDPILVVAPGELTVGYEGGLWQVNVQCNEDWYVMASGCDWVTTRINVKDGFVVNIKANGSAERRSVTLRVRSNSGEQTVVVNQLTMSDEYEKRQGDSLALVDLYNAMGGGSWYFDPRFGGAAWNFDRPFSEWWGVRTAIVDGERRVTQLDFMGMGLQGELPESMADLSQLTQLNLGYNRISGNPFVVLSKLPYLFSLDLGFNGMGGEVPQEVGLMGKLLNLVLAGNDFTGVVPQSLGRLTGLVMLDLSNNRFAGDPFAATRYLVNLQELNLSNNTFSGQVAEYVSNSSQLVKLNLSGCGFSGPVPVGLSLLANLQELNLAGNALTGAVPSRFTNLTRLEILNVSGNKISDVGGVAGCAGLKHLDASFNEIVGLSVGFGSALSALEYLDLQGNPLVSGFGADAVVALRGMSALTYLNVSGSELTDLSAVAGLGALVELVADRCKVAVLPVDMGGLVSLKRLRVAGGLLTGIPMSLFEVASLSDVDLSGNAIVGELPAGFGRLKNLVSLDLSENQITGTIPVAILGAEKMINFALWGNKMSGVIDERVLRDVRFGGETVTVLPEVPELPPVTVTKPGVWSPGYYICPQRVGYGFDNCDVADGDEDGGY